MKCTSHSQDGFVGRAQAVIYCTCFFSLSPDGEVEVVQAVIDVLQSDRVDFNYWKGAIILSAIPPSRVLQALGLAAAPHIGRGYIFGGKIHAGMRFGGCAAHGALVSRMRRACGVAFNP